MADINDTGQLGNIEISDEVIKKIAGQATTEVNGIFDLRGGFIEGIRQVTTGRRDFTKGVEVRRDPESAALDLDIFIIIEFNVKVGDVARAVQAAVKEKVEAITGNTVRAVNVHISDIRYADETVGRETRP